MYKGALGTGAVGFNCVDAGGATLNIIAILINHWQDYSIDQLDE